MNFSEEFSEPPLVQVTTVSLWTDYTPACSKALGPSGYYEQGIAMDAQLSFGESVTTKGFILRAGSSPIGIGCGGNLSITNNWIPNVVRWVATGKKKDY